jgi:L-threonylcarbamoyladenylate synthase
MSAAPRLPAGLADAIRWMRAGGVVAFPTDTFYGLAADPRRDAAVRALFEVKHRDEQAAVPLIAASRAQVESAFGACNEVTGRLADAFWPGPLSLVFDAPDTLSAAVHRGRDSVAVRVPAHETARALAEGLGFPITATSANLSGAPPVQDPADLDRVARDPRVFVLDGGPTPGGAPSTIVDARTTPVMLIRAGAIAWDRVLPFLYA